MALNDAEVIEKPEEKTDEATDINANRSFIGGEVRIVADPKTGGIYVAAPENLLVALGMLELAKVILVERQKENMKNEPVIKPATAADLKNLRPS